MPRTDIRKDKWIIHADINGHFCYSLLIYFPEMWDIPVVVGGNEEARHGIVLSKNQPAKKYKIQTSSSLYQARQLCPELSSLPPVYPLFDRTSKDFYGFMDRFTDVTAPFGCDGKTDDVSGTAHLFGGGVNSIRGVEAIVREMHERFPKEYGLHLSIGVSWNFPYAKMACDTAGPDGVKWIIRESPDDTSWQSQVFSMPAEELLYVGDATRNKLWNKGVRTIGELVDCGPKVLESWFGKVGLEHYVRAAGLDTTPYDMTREGQVHNMVHVLSSSVCQRMRAHKVIPKTVETSVTYSKDNDLHHASFQCPMPVPSSLDAEFAGVALDLFFKRLGIKKYPIRKITVRGKDLMFNTSVYQTTLEYNAARREKAMILADCKDEINERWKRQVRRCVELADPTLTGLGSKPNQQFAPAGWY